VARDGAIKPLKKREAESFAGWLLPLNQASALTFGRPGKEEVILI
jgi:hypothetical protein